MTTADPASGLERLNALITPDLWEQVSSENLAAVVGWGMMFNVAYLVRGIRTLHAADQCFAARHLMRSAIEYTMGTIWLADARQDAVDVLNRRLQGAHVKLLDDFGDTDLGALFPAGALQTFRTVMATELPSHPDERLAAFKHLLKEYGFEKIIPVYDVMSGLTHLSLEGAQEFFRAGDSSFRLSQQPLNGEVVPCEVLCLGMLFDTMLAYNELLVSKPWTTELAAIAKDHNQSTIPATRNRAA
jgi:hypothetical protein